MTNEIKKTQKNHKINFGYDLKEYWSIMRNYKGWIALLLVVLLISAAIDILGNFLFKIIVDNGTNFSNKLITADQFVKILLIVAGVFIGSEIILWIAEWFRHLGATKLETGAMYDLKKKYFNHLMGLSHNFYTTHKTGSLISRIVRGGSALERISDVLIFNAVPLVFQLSLVLITFIYFDVTTALVVLATIIVFVSYSLIIQRRQEPSNIEVNTTEDREKGTVADIFTNIDSIKYFGKESYIKKKFSDVATSSRQALFRFWSYYKYMGTGQAMIIGLGTFALIYVSVMQFLKGQMTLGTLVFIYASYGKLLGPLYGFVYGIRNFYRGMADLQDLVDYGKIESEIKDKPNAKSMRIKDGAIEFKNVTFNYGKRKIFDSFNLKINKNEKVAFVGHSGSGKTTLVKLLYRFYDVNLGQILIDGKDIKDFKHESLRGEMSVVPQECVLFDDTIYNNIAFSKPEATKEEVMKAIRFAQLDKIISKFPKKENTIVGERGVKLSGGEKQRVSIARAILADKQILVLDEATSSLDSQTEHDIQEYLKELMKGRTSIVIAHRLSTIMSADKIVVMKNGKIVQMGTHKQLIRQPGEYKSLWNLQRGGYIK